MNEDSPPLNLYKETEKSIEGINYWSWPDIVNALKNCQDCFPVASSSGIFDKVLDSLVGRITSGCDSSPTSSSPGSSAFWFSFDWRSIFSTKPGSSRGWWFDDLAVLNPSVIEKLVKSMVAQKLDHAIISRFLLYYLRTRVAAVSVEKKKATELVIGLLYCLDRNSVSRRGLFGLLRISSSLNISKPCQYQLESMIGSRFDQATLDNLLIPSSSGMDSLYDVNLVLRFLKHFMGNEARTSMTKLKRAGNLMDLYLAEVAPDSSLKPSKFVALIVALPDAARDSYDAIYRAVDMYLQVHSRLSEEVKMKICSVVNYEKLSIDSFQHLAMNSKFPSRIAIRAIVYQHSRLKSIFRETDSFEKVTVPLPKGMFQRKDNKQHDLYPEKLDLSMENEKLRCHLEGMQCRVMELEKTCKNMREQMSKVRKARIFTPRLCS